MRKRRNRSWENRKRRTEHDAGPRGRPAMPSSPRWREDDSGESSNTGAGWNSSAGTATLKPGRTDESAYQDEEVAA